LAGEVAESKQSQPVTPERTAKPYILNLPPRDISKSWYFEARGVAIFAKACFGHPCPSKQQKLNATANAFGAPIRPRHLVPTQQGVGT
jgi:hypothetical protein